MAGKKKTTRDTSAGEEPTREGGVRISEIVFHSIRIEQGERPNEWLLILQRDGDAVATAFGRGLEDAANELGDFAVGMPGIFHRVERKGSER